MKNKLKELLRYIKIDIVRREGKKLKKMPFDNKKRDKLKESYILKVYKITPKKVKEKAIDTINKCEPNNKYSQKEINEIVKKMLFYKKCYEFSFDGFYMYDLKNISEEEASKYISNGYGKYYLRYLNKDTAKITKNKYDTYLFYKKYYLRDMISVSSNKDYKSFCGFCKKNIEFVKKPTDAACGRGIELISTKDCDLKKLFDKLLKENNSFIAEGRIIQDKTMESLHPESVNTVRILPLIDKDGRVLIFKPFLKVGQGDSFVDNGGAGGILAGIDEKTGIVISDGKAENGKVYKEHPNTKVKFKGFQIPKWKELLSMFDEIVELNRNGRYLGWDVALSKDGWCIVECNSTTGFIGQQMPLKKGIKKEFEELIDWENVPNRKKYTQNKDDVSLWQMIKKKISKSK